MCRFCPLFFASKHPKHVYVFEFPTSTTCSRQPLEPMQHLSARPRWIRSLGAELSKRRPASKSRPHIMLRFKKIAQLAPVETVLYATVPTFFSANKGEEWSTQFNNSCPLFSAQFCVSHNKFHENIP